MVNRLTMEVLDVPSVLIGTRNVIIHCKSKEFKEGMAVRLMNEKKITTGIIYKFEESRNNTIKIDKYLRDELKVGIGNLIDVETIDSIPFASAITIAFPEEFEDEAIDLIPILENRVISENTIEPILEEGIKIHILKTLPGDVVKVNRETQIIIEDSNEALLRTRKNNQRGKVGKKPEDPIFSEIPSLKFSDIGGLDKTKAFLMKNVILPIKNPSLVKQVGYNPVKGILFFGPPGTGKTVLAMATAHEAGANFIYISASSFKDKWYGESERKMREAFEKAKKNQPTIVFIDEIDAVGASRQETRGHITVVNQLLTLFDQVKDDEVFVIAATNMLSIMDEALIRPGRLYPIEIPIPGPEEREKILRIYLEGIEYSDNDIQYLVRESEGYSGAQIMLVCNMAKGISLDGILNDTEDTSSFGNIAADELHKVTIQDVKEMLYLSKKLGFENMSGPFGKKPDEREVA